MGVWGEADSAPHSSLRGDVISRVAEFLIQAGPTTRVRVAVDGVTASGKSTLADELGAAVSRRGRPVVRLSMDGFHHRRDRRHQNQSDPAIGYYQDAYDFAALMNCVLRPLGPGGNGRYREAVIDLASDEPIDAVPLEAPEDAVLIVDGTFLQRPELADGWDVVVYVDTSLVVACARGVQRDAEAFGGIAAAQSAYQSRYHAACRHYLAEHDPAARADVVIGNDLLSEPLLQRLGLRQEGAP